MLSDNPPSRESVEVGSDKFTKMIIGAILGWVVSEIADAVYDRIVLERRLRKAASEDE